MNNLPKYKFIYNEIKEILLFERNNINSYSNAKKKEILKLLPHNKTFFKHNIIDGVVTISELCKYYEVGEERTEYIIILYINLYGVVTEIQNIKTNSINYKDFKQQIENTIRIFDNLNTYEKNKGNLKISKRAELLKSQFDKYLERKTLNSNLEKYFNIKTSYHIPTFNNIFTIAISYIERSFESYNRTITEAKGITKIVIKELIKKERFTSDLKYKRIIINGYSLKYDIYMPKLPKHNIFTLI
ncbi:hypothetical protein NG776_02540 [Aliarcobacter cryaerophilus]|uniref:hypothetical protein n=1 Tax=Aliarcobacter cryaerophilus TaxID=28198 RepID=UPI003DA58BAF